MKTLNKNKYRVLSIISKYAFVFVFLFSLTFVSVIVSAQDCTSSGSGTNTGSSGTNTGASGTNTGNSGTNTGSSGTNTGSDGSSTGCVKIDTGIKNPLGDNIKDIPTFIKTILNIVLLIGVPIIALAIIYSGFLFVAARGNAEELKKAKSTLVYTLIGAALLLGCLVIADAIKGTVDTIKNDQPQ